MGKRKIKRKGGPAGSRKGAAGMIEQLQGLQEDMLKAQDDVAAMTTGERRVQSLTIAPEVVDPEDVEMLQDLVIAAVNEGMEQVDRTMTERMSAFTDGLGIPGLL